MMAPETQGREWRYMEEGTGEGKEVDADGGKDAEAEAALGSYYATQPGQDGYGGGIQESGGAQPGQSGQASGVAGEAGVMASRLSAMENVRRDAETL
ncbi:hypothetical protein CYMTET_55746 [Cymbomonas tetramitiformis]|uniref:Uncharacterized protein n=1 Tax=Cymbomonas tetramitiformis TaxID=36881 RepID=A0AAE0BDG8_9CHLO|nr:hypothetical protein CYMTET_55746 [Cymbomonas tetramitiformis]